MGRGVSRRVARTVDQVTSPAYIPDLRSGRHLEARAAREFATWLTSLENQEKAARTRQHYAYTVADLLEANPDTAAEDFTEAHIEALLAGYPRDGRDTRRAHLSSFFGHLKRTRRIPDNPMEYVERPRRRKKAKLHDIFTEAESNLLCGLDTRDGALLTIMLECGPRKGECRGMQRRHFNLNRAELSIYGTSLEDDDPYGTGAKGGKDRVVPLTPRALAAIADLDLVERLRPNDYLWYTRPGGGKSISRRRPVADSSFRRWWTEVLRLAGVRYRKPHMTRHTRATVMRRLGYDLDEIQMFLGHESSQTTSDLYVHTNVYDVAARMAELEGVA